MTAVTDEDHTGRAEHPEESAKGLTGGDATAKQEAGVRDKGGHARVVDAGTSRRTDSASAWDDGLIARRATEENTGSEHVPVVETRALSAQPAVPISHGTGTRPPWVRSR